MAASPEAQSQERLAGAPSPSRFSVPSFLHGLGLGVFVFVLLFVWMWLRAEDTIARLQDKLPAKTAMIERQAAPAATDPLVKSVLEAPVKQFTPETPAPQDAPATVPETPAAAASGEEGQKAEPPAPAVTPEEAAAPEEKSAPAETAAPAVSAALPKAPVEGLYETRPEGQIPIADHARAQIPFEAYKRPVSLIPGRPVVALLFVGTGLSQSLSDRLIAETPPDVTLAVTPYAQTPGVWMDKSRAAGHESWLVLPLQTEDYPKTDPGPYAILNNMTVESSQGRLFSVMGAATGYAGLVSLDNHSFTAADVDASPVMRQIFGRGLAFADGRTDRPFFAQTLAQEQNYPFTQAHMWIGDDLTEAGALNALDAVGRHALSNGEVAAFIKPSPANVMAVKKWTANMEGKGLQLVPLSALIKQ